MSIVDDAAPQRAHTFHIPVMGTGFTIDTPIKVARYGITSVISLVDDVLIEQMRRYHSELAGLSYKPITTADEDFRARRITAYLNLLGYLVERQVEVLQAAPFEPGSEITRYFELLPEMPLRLAYERMLATEDPAERARLQEQLRPRAVPGSIDVNMLTKLVGERYRNGEKQPAEMSDAASALRGFAQCDLNSAIVFSAGLNPPLYTYVSEFPDFLPDAQGHQKKRVILKVSDFRSAEVQGRFLAMRGVWTSEYRVESGLNCGGHAFPSRGLLLGPILEEFRSKLQPMTEHLHALLNTALINRGHAPVAEPPPVRLTVQGGIGTAEEDRLMLDYYEVDGTGWGTPFLLVPEATNVDPHHRQLLAESTDEDVYLSDASPLGIPFWNLRMSASENARRARIAGGQPGSPCIKGFAACNTEFTTAPICAASANFQRRKLQTLADNGILAGEMQALRTAVTNRSCICHDLAGGATLALGIDGQATPAVCCGPGIVNFHRIASLEEMVGHIYGRLSLLSNSYRPHMFIRELMLYVDYLRRDVEKMAANLNNGHMKSYTEFRDNLLAGIEYYQQLAEQAMFKRRERFLTELRALREKVEQLQQIPALGQVVIS